METVINKKWYLSKTVWVNIIATVGIIAQAVTGKEIVPAEGQVILVSVVNFLLRTVTKENIIW